MDARSNPLSDATADREILISRTFDAPRELVWKAMTDPQHVVHWWGPDGFTTTVETMDLRVGGAWKHVMHGPDGTDYPNSSVFTEIVPLERIVFSHGDKAGGLGAHFVATWRFEALGAQTRLSVHMLFDTPADRDFVVKEFGAIEGGKQTLGRLAEYLPRMRAFVISRLLDAPRERVWRAWTEVEQLQQWFGPKGVTIPVSTMDLRPGGVFHYCMRTPDGNEMWGKWTFLEIIAPQRLVLINSFSDANGGITRHPLSDQWPLETHSTTTLTAQGDKTLLTIEWSPHNASAEEIKTFYSSFENMQQGWAGTFELLEAYLARGK